MEFAGAGVVTTVLPELRPWPIVCPETLYSLSWSISALVTTKSKN
jgi:hypothetical protein